MIQEKIEKLVNDALAKTSFKEVGLSSCIEASKDQSHGDYTTSVAFKVAGKVDKKPIEIAQEIGGKIKRDKDISKIETVGGFINFFLSEEALQKEIYEILEEKEAYGSGKEGKGKTVVIDYSSPNIAKSFGVGHLRSTIIGQAIYNIYKFRGWNVVGDNHLGDWGTQFGKLIYQIKEKKLKGLNSEQKKEMLNSLTIKDLEDLYIEFHEEVKDNPEMQEKGREWFKKLESKDDEANEIWQKALELSKDEFDRIYQILDVKIDNSIGESSYIDLAREITKEMQDKNIAVESDNALIVDFSQDLPPIIIKKSDGTTTYLARDLAKIRDRIERWNPEMLIYEVGVDQSLYFKQLFKIVEMLNWKKERQFVHLAHGLIRWQNKKFSTRRGETINLEDILNEAIDKSFELISNDEIDLQEKKEIAKMVGIGAVKYNDLSQHHQKDIIFDWQKALALKGNSGPYLQYTYARCQSVLRKEKVKTKDIDLSKMNDAEKSISRELVKFEKTVKDSADNFSPNIICNFLFTLAQKYNLFYNDNRILGDNKRLILTLATAQILKNGLTLLGIKAPEKM